MHSNYLPRLSDQNRSINAKQLDLGIGDTLVSVPVGGLIRLVRMVAANLTARRSRSSLIDSFAIPVSGIRISRVLSPSPGPSRLVLRCFAVAIGGASLSHRVSGLHALTSRYPSARSCSNRVVGL